MPLSYSRKSPRVVCDWLAWSHVLFSEPVTVGSDWPALGLLLILRQEVDRVSSTSATRTENHGSQERDSAARGVKGWTTEVQGVYSNAAHAAFLGDSPPRPHGCGRIIATACVYPGRKTQIKDEDSCRLPGRIRETWSAAEPNELESLPTLESLELPGGLEKGYWPA